MSSTPEKAAKRRHPKHDYYSKCIYLISINAEESLPPLCELSGDPDSETNPPRERSFRPGLVFKWELKRIVSDYPWVRILQYIVMPEHVHFIIEVKERIPYHLGTLIGELKARCTRSLGLGISFFEEGFNDRILLGAGQLQRMIGYVRDNPRRRLVKRLHPEWFKSSQILEITPGTLAASLIAPGAASQTAPGVASVAAPGAACPVASGAASLAAPGADYELAMIVKELFKDGTPLNLRMFGNSHLLLDPCIDYVKVSRSYTPEVLAKRKWGWFNIIREGGVLVSPFIHPDERKVREYAESEDGRVVLITRDYIGDRYKPQGHWFDLCASGRLLIISIYDGTQAGRAVTRAEAQRMNALARFLASSWPKTYKISRAPRG